MTNSYQQRQEDKADRLKQRAAAARAEGTAQVDQARTFFYNLNGQPMLPGHHSYRADVNRRQKHHDKMGRGFKNIDKAEELERRAANVGKAGIASDDPEAIRKLKEKLDYINSERDLIKTVNKITRRHAPKLIPGSNFDPAALAADLEAAGITADLRREAITKNYMGRVGIETYVLENRTAEANRLKKRIAELEAMHHAAEAGPAEWTGQGWEMWADHEQGRIFCEIEGGRLTRESFTAIRSAGGFNWSRRDERFVRKITPNALTAVKRLAVKLDELIEFE